MIEELAKQLRADPGLYYAYQANIAMAFKDECRKWETIDGHIYNEDIHKIANQAAKNFLDLLCKDHGTNN